MKKSLSYLLLVGAIFAIAIFEQVFLPSAGVFFFKQTLLFLFVFLVNFFCPGVFAIFLSFLIGLLLDFFSAMPFGVFSLVFPVLAFFIQFLGKRLRKSSIFSLAIVFVFSIFIFIFLPYFLAKIISFFS